LRYRYRREAWLTEIQQGGRCPVCAPCGFDPIAPTLACPLLLLEPVILKIGVTGEGKTRLDVHRAHGWDVV
jgi:hypothetical protein